MEDFFMSLITVLGGVVGILAGVAIIGVVVAVGLLPLVFINRPNELRNEFGHRTSSVGHEP